MKEKGTTEMEMKTTALNEVLQAIKNDIEGCIEVEYEDNIFKATTEEDGFGLIAEMEYLKVEFFHKWKLSPHVVKLIGEFYEGELKR